ncbi:MAG: MCE family protein [Chitinivibrionales bacterium]|nr:MCE family protein [Chitinivibrionales bacterium]
MAQNTIKFKVRLGLFITAGLALFMVAIFFIGKQKNLFDPIIRLSTTFNNISGLQVGSNIRFAGITVGIVDNIAVIDDSTVKVDLSIKENIQKFIKADCFAGIGSSGVIGDRVLIIYQGSTDAPSVKDGQHIASKEPIEIDGIMESVKVTADNTAVISAQLAKILIQINSGNGTLGRLLQDSTIAENVNQTIRNLKSSTQGLNENMNAAKDNFFFRGFFKKKQKADQKAADAREKKKEDKKKRDDAKKKALKKKNDAKE